MGGWAGLGREDKSEVHDLNNSQATASAAQPGEAPIKRGPTVPPAVRIPAGPDRAPEGPWGRRRVPCGSMTQLRTDTGSLTDSNNDPNIEVRPNRQE